MQTLCFGGLDLILLSLLRAHAGASILSTIACSTLVTVIPLWEEALSSNGQMWSLTPYSESHDFTAQHK